jgi:hypothetical protein
MSIPIGCLKIAGIVGRPHLDCVPISESLEQSLIERWLFNGPKTAGRIRNILDDRRHIEFQWAPESTEKRSVNSLGVAPQRPNTMRQRT